MGHPERLGKLPGKMLSGILEAGQPEPRGESTGHSENHSPVSPSPVELTLLLTVAINAS